MHVQLHLPQAAVQCLLSRSGPWYPALALALGENPWADHLTRWDEAAALMVLSMASAWLVDPQEVAAIVQALPPS